MTRRRWVELLLGALALNIGFLNCGRFAGFNVVESLNSTNLSSADPNNPNNNPVFQEGAKLYAQHCALCHNPLASSLKLDRTVNQIETANKSVLAMASNPAIQNLTSAQIQAIATALKTTSTEPGVNPFYCQAGARPTPHRLQRLAKSEYMNTLRDLFVGTVALSELAPEMDLFPEELSSENPFDRGADSMNLGLVQAQNKISVKIASLVTASTTKLNQIFSESCFAASTVTDTCLGAFIDRFGTRVYRRPVKAIEKAPLIAAYRLGTTPAESSGYLLRALLMSPNFLYHLEFDGTPVDVEASGLKLNAYELASRLSYLIVNSMPDAELMAAAANSSLLQPAIFDAQLIRLLSQPAARASLRRFFAIWFDMQRMRNPSYTDVFRGNINTANINAEAFEESMLFVDHILFEGKKLEDLLTDTTAFIKSAELAKIYGVSLPGTPDGRTSLPSNQRAGILTRAARNLSGDDTTSPILRGIAIRRSLLCESLSSPDPNTLPPGSLVPPTIDPTLSTRERFEIKTSPTLCMSCHGQINSFGYALENYDALGRYRTIEKVFSPEGQVVAEHPIDAVATLNFSAGNEAVVNGWLGLSSTLSENQRFQMCFSRKWFQFTFRRLPTALDNCVLAKTYEAVKKPDSTLFDSIKAMVLDSEFGIRRMK